MYIDETIPYHDFVLEKRQEFSKIIIKPIMISDCCPTDIYSAKNLMVTSE
tara:strand:- start:1402 stop:1551 length:150 start_codon:yes stop_codon:yes gene_type:complete